MAAIVGAAIMQVRTIAELATASIRNEPTNSPAASNARAAASSKSEPFATLVTLILFLLVRARMPTSVNGVR